MAAKVGKATAARRQAEDAAKAAGQTPAQVKQAGLDARAKVDPRLASTETVYRPGGGDGKGLVGMSWATSANAPGIRRTATKTSATSTAATAPAETPAAPVQQNDYNPTPLVPEVQQQQPSLNIMMPEMPEAPAPQYSAGGAGAEVGTNALGARRKKSSGRLAGLTSKGTSVFKIGGQSARSSGLNIGT
jgi:hypothetical protein